MKHGKLWLALAALGLIVATVVFGDNNVLDHGTYFGNAATGAKVDASGNATVTESAPAMDANLTFASIINNTALATATGDSSAILDTHRMRLGMLLFKIVPSTGTGVLTRLAVSVRVHLNGASDSSSVFPIFFNFGKDQPVLASAALDTANGGHLFTGSATAAWSGEFIVTAATNRNSPASVVAATAWQYPSGIAVPLNNIYGREVWAPYISVRVRNMQGPTAAVTVSLVGTPL